MATYYAAQFGIALSVVDDDKLIYRKNVIKLQ